MVFVLPLVLLLCVAAIILHPENSIKLSVVLPASLLFVSTFFAGTTMVHRLYAISIDGGLPFCFGRDSSGTWTAQLCCLSGPFLDENFFVSYGFQVLRVYI